MNLLDLFSGVGSFSLGLEAAGFKTSAFCEIEPYQCAVLKKHWPDVRQYEDVTRLTAAELVRDGIHIDAICGGFPCQDVSNANAAWGECLGLEGSRSGLFFDVIRIVRDIRPRVVFLENVAQLLGNGMLKVCQAFAEIGYDVEWEAIPMSYAGGIQNRDRIWIVAYPSENGEQRLLSGLDFSKARQGRTCSQKDLPRIYADPFNGDSWPQPLIRRGDGRPANWAHRIESCGNTLDPAIAEEIGRAVMRNMK